MNQDKTQADEIKRILAGTSAILALVSQSSQYRSMSQSEYFATSNDLSLEDAIQAIDECLDAFSDALLYANHFAEEDKI
jgi:hypothetical protein